LDGDVSDRDYEWGSWLVPGRGAGSEGIALGGAVGHATGRKIPRCTGTPAEGTATTLNLPKSSVTLRFAHLVNDKPPAEYGMVRHANYTPTHVASFSGTEGFITSPYGYSALMPGSESLLLELVSREDIEPLPEYPPKMSMPNFHPLSYRQR